MNEQTKPAESAKPTEPAKPSPKPDVRWEKPAAKAEQPKPLSLREQRDLQMSDPTSPLRNQATVEDTVDFQLLSNTPAQTIAAMTGWNLAELAERAKALKTTLKGSLAGDFKPQS